MRRFLSDRLPDISSEAHYMPLQPNPQRTCSERGAGKITLMVFGLITAVLLFCGYKIIPFFYCYYEITNQFEQVIHVASTYTDKEVRDKLMYHIKKLELPVEPDDLKIEREVGKMRISLPYEEVFYVSWDGKDYDLYTFKFHAYAEGNY